MRNKKTTIHDVAAAAGVSYQTISRVLNGRPDVSDETRQRVLEIVQQMDYQPSAAARTLTKGRSMTIGVVASGLQYFGPSQTLVGVESYASQMGYSLMLQLAQDPELDDFERIFDELLTHQVAGVIWTVPEIGSNHSWIRNTIPRLPVPVIFTNATPAPGISVVQIDNLTGGHIATRHLLEQGYQNLGIITGPPTWVAAQDRLEGWRQELVEAGRTPQPFQIAEGDWSTESGERAFEELVQKYPDMDAVFASNDQMALGVLQVIYRGRKRVPRDMALVGFDDIPQAAYFFPSMTTIRQDMIEVGKLAMQSLARLIETYQHRNQAHPPEVHLVQPSLVVRDSSGRR